MLRMALLWPLPALVLWPVPGAARDQDKVRPDKPPSVASQYEALLQEFTRSGEELNKAHLAARTEAERRKFFVRFRRVQQEFARRFLDLAQKHPKDPAAYDALAFVANFGGTVPEAGRALDFIFRDHRANPKIAELCPRLEHSLYGEKFLRAVFTGGADRTTRGLAGLFLARHLKGTADEVRQLREPAGLDEEAALFLGPEAVKALKRRDPDRMARQAEEVFKQVREKYGDVKYGEDHVKDLVGPDLYELRHLAIGRPAPEIEGKDAGGKPMKLSEFRGRVVVLNFWGNW